VASGEFEDDVLGRAGLDRRAFITRLVAGAAFAVPAIQSIDLGRPRPAWAQPCTPTEIVLRTAPNPSGPGQPVQILVDVVQGFGTPVPSATPGDTVEIFVDGSSLGTLPYDQDTVSLVVSTLTAGAHTITASYSGQANFCPATSDPFQQFVATYPLPEVCENRRDSPEVLVDTDPNPSTLGQPVTITALLHFGSRGFAPGESLTDTVEFFDGNTSLGIVPWDRNPVSIVVSTLTAGPHTITAKASGDCSIGFQGAVSEPVTHTVTAAYPLAVAGPAPGPIAAELPAPAGGTSPLPAALAVGSGLAAAAIAYQRSRRTPSDE
jgi:hypothetical protein